jgi:hypothetical protein
MRFWHVKSRYIGFENQIFPLFSGTKSPPLIVLFCLVFTLSCSKNSEDQYQKSVLSKIPPHLICKERDSTRIKNPAGFKLVSDPHTKIETIFIQTIHHIDPFLVDLLHSIRKDIRVIIIASGNNVAKSVYNHLINQNIEKLPKRIRFIIFDPSTDITKWGRDPFVVTYNKSKDKYAIIPAVTNRSRFLNDWGPDIFVPEEILSSDIGHKNVFEGYFKKPWTWILEGGSVTSDQKYAYMGQLNILASQGFKKNEHTYSEEDIIESLEKILGKSVFVFPSFEIHSDRYHIPVGKTRYGGRTSLLADPMEALKILANLTPVEKEEAINSMLEFGQHIARVNLKRDVLGNMRDLKLTDELHPEFIRKFFDNMTPELIAKIGKSAEVISLNKVERVLKNHGNAVVRIPTLNRIFYIDPKPGQKMADTEKVRFPFSFTYTNIIQDSSRQGRVAIIPKYGVKKLDEAAYRVFESLEAFDEIHQVRSVQEAMGAGGPRCRVQILGKPYKDKATPRKIKNKTTPKI